MKHIGSDSGMGQLKLKISGRKFPRMDLFSKSDPYLCILMPCQGVFAVKAKTEVKKNNHDPDWEPLILEDTQIRSNNKSLKMKFQVANYFYFLIQNVTFHITYQRFWIMMVKAKPMIWEVPYSQLKNWSWLNRVDFNS